MGFHRLPQSPISSEGSHNQVTQISTNQFYKCQKCSRVDSYAKPMNPEGENLGKCNLEGIKGFLAEPSEVGPKFDTWLKVLNPTP